MGVVLTAFNFIMNTLHIAYDSREQRPMHDLAGVEVSKGVVVKYSCRPISVFDYALVDDLTPTNGKLMNPGWSCERKSMSDFIGSFFNGDNSRREFAKVAKARALWGAKAAIVYVCEFDLEMLKAYDYSRFPSGKISPKVVFSKINSLCYQHNIHVKLCRSRIQAEGTIISLLRQHSKSVLFKNAVKAQKEHTQ